MSVINGASNTVTGTIPVGSYLGVGVDPATDTIYVTNYGRQHRVGD